MKKIALICLLTLGIPSTVFAEYYANGEIIGHVQSGIGKYLPNFIKPTQKIVHSVKQADGKIYKIKRVFKDSDVTINPQGECIVHPDHEPILLAVTPEGNYEELHNVLYLEFTCYKD